MIVLKECRDHTSLSFKRKVPLSVAAPLIKKDTLTVVLLPIRGSSKVVIFTG